MPTLLSDLINAIPIAGRGDVISPESHNSRRDAIVAIVTELGGAVESRNVTLTFIPAFLATPKSDEKAWIVEIGYAKSPPSGATSGIVGWLPLQLPAGSRIQQLRVVFGGTGRLFRMNVKLQRQFIRGDASAQDLANLSVESLELNDRQFEENAPFSLDPGVRPPAGAPPADIVNNDEYKYFVRAHMGDVGNAKLNIFAIRVDCRLG